MFKRKTSGGSYTSLIRDAKKRKLETDLEKEFKESCENRVWEADELPLSVVKVLYHCITGKIASGQLQPAIKSYRDQVRSWLKEVLAKKNISDRLVASRIRCALQPAEHLKLGIRQFLEVFDSGMPLGKNTDGSSHFSTLSLINVPTESQIAAAPIAVNRSGLQEQPCFSHPMDVEFNEQANRTGFSQASLVLATRNDEQTPSDEGIQDAEFPILVSIKEEEGFLISPEDINQSKSLAKAFDDDEELMLTLFEIFQEWRGDPISMGVSEACITNLFRRIKYQYKGFTHHERLKFPSHGTALGRIPPRCLDNIKFRNLLHYIPAIDDFIAPPPPPPRKRIRRKKIASAPPSNMIIPVDDVAVADGNNTACGSASLVAYGTDESSSSSDSNDDGSESCEDNQDNDDDSDYAKDPGSTVLTIEDDGLEEQIELDKKKEVQEMAYMGIENVLLKKNPGILDCKAFENTLKAMMLLDPHCLSDEFVEAYFTEKDEKPLKGDRGSEPLFVLDLFIDGVPVFKSSKNASCIAVMGRVVKVNGTYIPHKRSKPFIIGFYHGCVEKPDLNAFLSDLIKELKYLDPERQLIDKNEKRSVTVQIRALIADAPARAWLKCIKGHSGYFACERCRILGEILRVSTTQKDVDTEKRKGMKFSTLHDAKRVDEEWDEYLSQPEPMQPVEGATARHRTGVTPLDKIAHLVKPISSFPLEEMHVVDGGGIKDAIKMLLKLPKSWTTKLKQKRKLRKVVVNKITQKRTYNINIRSARARKRRPTKRRPAQQQPDGAQQQQPTPAAEEEEEHVTLIKTKDLVGWNCRIANWSKFCTPAEFPRRVSKLTSFKYWKMVECRQFFMYYLVPLMLLDIATFDKQEFNLVVKFIKAYSLITGSSYLPVPEEDIQLAERYFKEFFEGMIRFNKKYATLKVHNMWKHLVEDARHFRCRTTSLSSYPFENEVSFFRKCRLLNGRYVVKQLTNKLIRRHLFRTQTKEDRESLRVYVDHVRSNGGRLHFPAFHIWEYDFNKQLVECESLKISRHFPNNVVCLKDSAGYRNATSIVAIGCIDFIFPDTSSSGEQGLKLQVRCFKKVSLAFKAPFNSSEIGLYHCEGGLEDRILQIPFSDLKYKCFAIPKKLPARAPIDPKEVQQSWICQMIRHSDFY